MFVEIPETLQPAIFELSCAVLVGAKEPGNVIVNELRGGGVVADNDEARRNSGAGLLPYIEGLFVVTVKRVEGGAKLGWQIQRIEVSQIAVSAASIWQKKV